MRFSFFATSTTLKKLYAPEMSKVLLAGGFNGYWNFGDILMLQGAVRWHLGRKESAVVSIHELGRVQDAQYLRQLPVVLGTEDFVFFSADSGDTASTKARELGLEPVSPTRLRGAARLHVYGGGYFNGRWGDGMLSLVESLLHAWLPGHYVLSGLQVGPEFASRLAAHAHQWQPLLLGCRDPESVQALVEHGAPALLSGDDALEELDRAAGEASRQEPRPKVPGRFALHMNLSTYAYTDPGVDPDSLPPPAATMNEQLQALRSHFGEAAAPVVLNAYIDERPVVEDSLAAMRKTAFTEHFPQADVVDLVGLLFQGRLSQAVERIRECEALVASSYHVTLLGKVSGVPSHLFAFNEYYRQKKAGLAESETSLKDFLEGGLTSSVERGGAYIEEQRRLRREWLSRLEASLAQPVANVNWVSRAATWLEEVRAELRQEKQLRAEETHATRGALEELQARHHALLARCEAGEARVRELEQQLAHRDAEGTALRGELHGVRELLASKEFELECSTRREEELRASYEALLTTEPPLRHRLVDDLNDRLIKSAGGQRAHRAIKHLVRVTVGRGK